MFHCPLLYRGSVARFELVDSSPNTLNMKKSILAIFDKTSKAVTASNETGWHLT